MHHVLSNSVAHLNASLCRCLIGMGLTCLTFPAQAADIFVDNTGFGGAYTTIQAAFSAAGANDTIWVRGGQTFGGAALTWTSAKNGARLYGGWDGNMVTPSSNAGIRANDPSNLAIANPARLAETVFSAANPLANVDVSAGLVNGVTIRGFNIQNSAGSGSVDFPSTGVNTAQNIDISNNHIASTGSGTQGVNMQQGQGIIQNVLLSGNRVTLPAAATAKTAFYIGAGPGQGFRNSFTIVDNYIKDNNPQGVTTGVPNGSNNRAINADWTDQAVIAGNYFDSMGNQSVGNVNSSKDFIIAENQFIGGGKTGRAMIISPRINQAGDSDMERILISNNEISGHVLQGIDLTTFTGAFTGDDGWEALWIRHNQIDANATDLQTGGGLAAVSMRFVENTGDNGPVTFENNEINITGNRTTSELQAVRLVGDLPTAGTGGLTIQNNNFNALGSTAGVPYVGIRLDPLDTTFGNMGAVSINITNNNLNGFPTAVGVYDTLSSSTVGNLAAGSTVNVNNNNFLGLITNDFVHGVVGPNIDGQNNHYADSTANATGNVTTNANVGSPFSVVGRDANYVSFRGDHNLSNAVDASDAVVLLSNFGSSGPGVSYFDGDSTLDQVVDLDDGKVFARFFNQPIAASGVITNPASAGPPSVLYDSFTGTLSFTAGAQGSIWGLRLMDGTTALMPLSTSPTALNSSWLYTNQPQGIEFYDDSFGTLGDFAGNGVFAIVAPGLSPANFGQVEYFFGQGANVSSAFTSVTLLLPVPEPSTFTLLAMGMAAVAIRRRRR